MPVKGERANDNKKMPFLTISRTGGAVETVRSLNAFHFALEGCKGRRNQSVTSNNFILH